MTPSLLSLADSAIFATLVSCSGTLQNYIHNLTFNFQSKTNFAYPGRILGGDGAVMGGLDLLFSLSEMRVLDDDDDELVLVLFTAAFAVWKS